MSEMRCTKCGSTNLEVEEKGTQTGLYCCDCGKWIKWLTKNEIRVFNHNHLSEEEIRADERAKVLTQFLFELGKNVAYEKQKVFGTDVIRIDALMTICHEIEEQLKEQNNDN